LDFPTIQLALFSKIATSGGDDTIMSDDIVAESRIHDFVEIVVISL